MRGRVQHARGLGLLLRLLLLLMPALHRLWVPHRLLMLLPRRLYGMRGFVQHVRMNLVNSRRVLPLPLTFLLLLLLLLFIFLPPPQPLFRTLLLKILALLSLLRRLTRTSLFWIYPLRSVAT